jgi:hypothetical protein
VSTILICDECGKQSPNARGEHIANHWYGLRPYFEYRVGRFDHTKTALVCRECVEQALPKAVREAAKP